MQQQMICQQNPVNTSQSHTTGQATRRPITRKLSTILVLLLTCGFAGNAAANVCNVWWDFPPDYGVSLGASFTLPECQDAFNHWWIDRCAETVDSHTDTSLEYWDGKHPVAISWQCVVCTDGYPDGYC